MVHKDIIINRSDAIRGFSSLDLLETYDILVYVFFEILITISPNSLKETGDPPFYGVNLGSSPSRATWVPESDS